MVVDKVVAVVLAELLAELELGVALREYVLLVLDGGGQQVAQAVPVVVVVQAVPVVVVLLEYGDIILRTKVLLASMK